MKMYVTDIPYALAHENELRKLRLGGNLVALCGDISRQGMMRRYYMLANIFIADHGEFVFSGCHILYNNRSENLEKVIEILKEEKVTFSIGLPYTNACGGINIIAKSDPAAANDLYSYALEIHSEQEEERIRTALADYCSLEQEEGHWYLVFHESSYEQAVEAAAQAENVKAEDVVFLCGQL